ncbi:imidazole glycerol phosphate synthase subunit HisH [Sporolactobacillus terrae]|uniref:Imidazole glycerol phosphate synthase subunit HisH n=1 Tax=Sporolactobacillus terrae TaxID=269673 RepID=A0ABX5Q8T6_9BACL|nr:imidazole glycerol phosphate synthase subunit HisH [Sporolactobacillus terrae]QAA23030.1 imidazole glycerol phosphate synthase subunit HisH [Sporolactobacillus terrae]QAA26003.1 imidazole glycerol phosphate synthase subunit HisH [Sporolactobacillus terrae]UAK15097.1 imidazole glycerol phosphate synthase subunit HisH [Sporolactobacillus terrae]
MIGIVDYGMGNLYSLSQALERLEQPYVISDDPSELDKSDGLILPGVGAFKDAMGLLNQKKLSDYLSAYAEKKPLLGICLGMQLLFDESEEGVPTKGLGLIAGRVVRFSGISEKGGRYKVPHMGWNTLTFVTPDSVLLNGLKPDYAYFVHSYRAKLTDRSALIAVADYDGEVPAVVGKGRVFGTQFHPEKSGAFGQALLKNYLQFVHQDNKGDTCDLEKGKC